MPSSPTVGSASPVVSFEVGPAHQALDMDGLLILHPDVVRRCQFMFGVRFYWTLTARHEKDPLGLELTIPSISFKVYQAIFRLKAE